jgi:uncharacterized membrane protein YdfJ with MMPL/SSD domain
LKNSYVQHVQHFLGDSLTADGARSPDDKGAYVQVSLAGKHGEDLPNKSVAAIRRVVTHLMPPNGVKAFVAGPSALVTDMHYIGDESLIQITAAIIAVIFFMLQWFYRLAITVILLPPTVGIEFAASRQSCAGREHRNCRPLGLCCQPTHGPDYRGGNRPRDLPVGSAWPDRFVVGVASHSERELAFR